jgi:hypothetical protein
MIRDGLRTRVLVYVSKEGCITDKDLMERYGLSKAEAQKILEGLVEEGELIRRAVYGALLYCMPKARTPDRFKDPEYERRYYKGPVECLKVEKFREALVEVIKGHRGHQATIRPKHIVAHLPHPCRLRSTVLIRIATYVLLAEFRPALIDRRKWLFDLDKLKILIAT